MLCFELKSIFKIQPGKNKSSGVEYEYELPYLAINLKVMELSHRRSSHPSLDH